MSLYLRLPYHPLPLPPLFLPLLIYSLIPLQNMKSLSLRLLVLVGWCPAERCCACRCYVSIQDRVPHVMETEASSRMVLIWYIYDTISLSTLLQSIPSYTFICILLTLTLHSSSSISILEATYVILSCERRRASPSSAVRPAQVTYSTFYCDFYKRNLSTNLSEVRSYISFTFFLI